MLLAFTFNMYIKKIEGGGEKYIYKYHNHKHKSNHNKMKKEVKAKEIRLSTVDQRTNEYKIH
jgi:hypothetical protein